MGLKDEQSLKEVVFISKTAFFKVISEELHFSFCQLTVSGLFIDSKVQMQQTFT